MLYNYARFDNPLEFGHNYLPEFVRAENGQFSIEYFGHNFLELFTKILPFDELFNPEISVTFAFYFANPLYILWWYRTIKNIVKTHRISKSRLIFTIAIFLNILLICFHRTLGGWQFGARYTCDMLPFVFLCILISTKKYTGEDSPPPKKLFGEEVVGEIKLDIFEIGCIIIAILLNAYGVISMW